MADIHGDPRDVAAMPQAGNSGPAPVPYGGPREFTEPPLYDPGPMPLVDVPSDIIHGIPSHVLGLSESSAATDMSPLAVSGDAPYYPGSSWPINANGDPDAGGRDDVAGTVAGAVANSHARYTEFMGDNGTTGTPGPGAQPVHAGNIGDLMHFPPSYLDPGAGVGNTLPTGGFYDPPRDYGGGVDALTNQGAPGHIGNEPPPGFQGAAQ